MTIEVSLAYLGVVPSRSNQPVSVQTALSDFLEYYKKTPDAVESVITVLGAPDFSEDAEIVSQISLRNGLSAKATESLCAFVNILVIAGATAGDFQELKLKLQQLQATGFIKTPGANLWSDEVLAGRSLDTRTRALVSLGTSDWFYRHAHALGDLLARVSLPIDWHNLQARANRMGTALFPPTFASTMEALAATGVTEQDFHDLRTFALRVYGQLEDVGDPHGNNPANRLSALSVYRFFHRESVEFQGEYAKESRPLLQNETAVFVQASKFPGNAIPLSASDGAPYIQCERGRGFRVLLTQEDSVLRIHRSNGGKSVFASNDPAPILQDGDVFQLDERLPTEFVDPVTPPFANGHRYAASTPSHSVRKSLYDASEQVSSQGVFGTYRSPYPLEASLEEAGLLLRFHDQGFAIESTGVVDGQSVRVWPADGGPTMIFTTRSNGQRHAIFLAPGDVVQVNGEMPWTHTHAIEGLSEGVRQKLERATGDSGLSDTQEREVIQPMPVRWVHAFREAFQRAANTSNPMMRFSAGDATNPDQRLISIQWSDHEDPSSPGFSFNLGERGMEAILWKPNATRPFLHAQRTAQVLEEGEILRFPNQPPFLFSYRQLGIDPSLNTLQAWAYRSLNLFSYPGMIDLKTLTQTIEEMMSKSDYDHETLVKAWGLIVLHQGWKEEVKASIGWHRKMGLTLPEEA